MGKLITTNEDGYKDSYPEKLEFHLSRGYSVESFVGVVRQDLEIILGWVKKYPEFSAACKYGEAKARFFYEGIGIDGMQGKYKGFQGKVWDSIMEERFGYGQKKNKAAESTKMHTTIYLPYNGREKETRIIESKVMEIPEITQHDHDSSDEFEDEFNEDE
jgi:hypothetical protein